MKIALVAATHKEIEPALEYLSERLFLKTRHRFTTVVTGVGMINTTYTLTKKFAVEKPEIAIQCGIAGTLHPVYLPGSVLAVKEEIIGDLGVVENEQLMDVFDMALAEADDFPFHHGKLINPHYDLLSKTHLLAIRGVTVNEITTKAEKIHQLIEKYAPVVESMEGAAFHYVCLQEGIPFVQLRAISNFIGERDKQKWKMKEAICNLNNQLISFINKLTD
ncbi:MAG: futalosine hydrolase [Chitinophagaceae bacterium]|nr:futalosine hydrolase [Chitinophagaceae bacterium]